MDNEVIHKIIAYLPPKRHKTPSGWESFNCVMCHHNGEPTPDFRRKGGIKFNGDSIQYHCFRCGYKAHWRPGLLLSRKMQRLLKVLGASEEEIAHLKRKCIELKQVADDPEFIETFSPRPKFDLVRLPEGSKRISELRQNPPNRQCEKVIDYIDRRGFGKIEFYWLDSPKNQMANRIILPFYHEGKVVGWTARLAEDVVPPTVRKYHSYQPTGYLFNADLLDTDREYIVVVEGAFDALAINCVGLLGNEPSKQQIAWLNGTGKKIIWVPDRNEEGLEHIDVAIENNWYVSFPDWEDGITDVDGAAKQYGPIWTAHQIIQNATRYETKIRTYAKVWV